MSSTITVDRMISALRCADNSILYVLYEKTYESNCTPHTPQWSAVGAGPLETIMAQIFELGSACESGMLRGRSAALTPEGYIGTWLTRLKNPIPQEKQIVTLSFNDEWRQTHGKENVHNLCALLKKAGYPEKAESLHEYGSVDLNLKTETAAVMALMNEGLVYAWKLLTTEHRPRSDSMPDHTLGYNPKTSKAMPPENTDQFLRLKNERSSDDILVQAENQTWSRKWEYRVIKDYVQGFAQTELQYPGSYRKMIKAMRKAIAECPTVPDDATVTINPEKVESDSQKKYVEITLGELQILAGNNATSGKPVRITPQNCGKITGIPEIALTWNIPHTARAESLRLL